MNIFYDILYNKINIFVIFYERGELYLLKKDKN